MGTGNSISPLKYIMVYFETQYPKNKESGAWNGIWLREDLFP
jgi:hypothetical protein